MARYTVLLRSGPKGWEWNYRKGWWGPYKTEGLARSAAKRSITPVVGGKTDPKDYEFVHVENTGSPS
jgi:hypothetical protein